MKKFIAKYVVIVALLTCAFACISGVSAEEIVTFGDYSAQVDQSFRLC